MRSHDHRRAFMRTMTAISAGLLLITAIPNTRSSVGESRAAGVPATGASERPDWLAEAQQSISEREYEATGSNMGLQAPNRAHRLRTYFEADGARVVDREDDANELTRIRTIAVNGDALSSGTVIASGARVEVRRPGLAEWYENTERGLEQGWTIESRTNHDMPLSVEIDFDVEVYVEDERAVVKANGRWLEYGGLRAWDANGATLPARMEPVGAERLRIVVDDTRAVYPVTVDPTLAAPVFATLTSDQINAQVGYSVAGAGDVNGDGYADVIVGAPNYDTGLPGEGAAFVFLGGPSGIASARVGSAITGPGSASARLESNQLSANLGVAVAGAGDVNGDGYADVIVGADGYDSGQTDEGAAFIFLGGPSGIENGNPATAATKLESNQTNAHFGAVVASAGDVNGDGLDDVIVGAVLYDTTQSDAGAAFVFLGRPSGIANGSPSSAGTTLRGSQVLSRFGVAVDGAGDVNADGYDDVIVGARFYDAGQSDEGAAFVFLGGPTGISSALASSANTILESNQPNAFMGAAVAGVGDTNGDGYDDVIVGANTYDAGETDEGAAFLFHGGPGGVANGNPFTAAAVFQSDQTNAQLGLSVAGAGDVDGDGYADLLLGAYLADAGQTDEGTAMLYFGRATGVPSGPRASTVPTILQQDKTKAWFGFAVAGAGDVNGDGYADVIAGGPCVSVVGLGVACIYVGGERGLHGFPGPDAVMHSNQYSAGFGSSVAGVGDVNGDGYDDVAVGAAYYDAGQVDEGAVFIFHGGPDGIQRSGPEGAATILEGDQSSCEFARREAVAGAGDVNGDGYDDVIVGAPRYDAGQTDEGVAFVFHGGPSGIPSGSPATADAILQSDQASSDLGRAVAGAGDVNGDGYADVIVGASRYDAGQIDEGAVLVFYGGPSGVGNGSPANVDAFLERNVVRGNFGLAVSGAGDVDGNGYDDMAVCLCGSDTASQAVIYSGSPGGVAPTPTAIIDSGQAVGLFFDSIAGAGDVNGDGFDDIVIGSSEYDENSIDGAAFVVHGSPAGIPSGLIAAVAATSILSRQWQAALGLAVAGAGDVNGDGYDDIVVSAMRYVRSNRASAFVFLGGPTGVAATSPRDAVATLSEVGPGTGGVAGAGDVNGDGFDEVIVGFFWYSGEVRFEGAAFVYYLTRPPEPSKATPTSLSLDPKTGVLYVAQIDTGQSVRVDVP